MTNLTKKHHRTTAQIKEDFAWIQPYADEIKRVFGGYSKLVLKENGEKVFSWEKKEPKKPAIKMSMNRKPHKWTDKEDLCLRKK